LKPQSYDYTLERNEKSQFLTIEYFNKKVICISERNTVKLFQQKIRVCTAIYFEVYNLNLGHDAFQLTQDLAGSMKL